jgi:glutathione S-transferase
MRTLYHVPISLNSRRVWVALLEKGLEFELQDMKKLLTK